MRSAVGEHHGARLLPRVLGGIVVMALGALSYRVARPPPLSLLAPTGCTICTDQRKPEQVYGNCCNGTSDCYAGVACKDHTCCSDGSDSGRRCGKDADCCYGLTCRGIDSNGLGDCK